MSDLFALLSSTAQALDAQRFGIDTVGQNIANVNTPGYSRRRIDLAAIPPYEARTAGSGVEVLGVRAVRDALLDRRLQLELPGMAREEAIADALALVEVVVGVPGQSIDSELSEFFDAFSRLADDPTLAPARLEVIDRAQSLAAEFHGVSANLTDAGRDADQGIRQAVEDVNSILERITRTNDALVGESLGSAEQFHLKDEQGEDLKKLAELVDISVIARQEGGVDVTFANGQPLVLGGTSFPIAVTSIGPSGYAALSTDGVDVTGQVSGGKIGGLLRVRDVLVPNYQNVLDDVAYGVVQEVNTLHDAGFDLNGVDAGVFFAPLGGPAGAASLIAVDSAIAADPSLVAAASIPASGDNQTARAIADLRDALTLSGGTATFSDGYAQLIYQVGRDSQAARSERSSRSEVVKQVETLREIASGVSLDEETVLMLKFQRAYEANARFFSVVDGLLDTMMQWVGR